MLALTGMNDSAINVYKQTSTPPSSNVSLIAQKTLSSEKETLQENKPVWTTTRVISGLFLGCIALGVIAGAIDGVYKHFLTHANTADPNAANCIEFWDYGNGLFRSFRGVKGTCCPKELLGSSSECENIKKAFRETILSKNPGATFSYLIRDFSAKLSPIASKIESGLLKLSTMNNTDSINNLKKDLAHKLFIDLPNYCNALLPEEYNTLRSKTLLKELDYMHERHPGLLSKNIASSLWRQLASSLHPDKKGNTSLFTQAESAYGVIKGCVKHLEKEFPSCRWLKLKPLENSKALVQYIPRFGSLN